MRLRICWIILYSIVGVLTAHGQIPHTAADYCSRGLERQERGDIDGAIADFSKAIELNPRFYAAYANRGAARRKKGDLDGALEDCTKAIELNPRDPRAYSNRGNVRADRGDLQGAIVDNTKAIKLNPRLAPAYYNRGRAYKKLAQYHRSIIDYSTAIQLDPQFSWAYNNLAWLLATCHKQQVRDGKKAIEYAMKACELTNWQDPDMLGTLASAYAETGNFDEAIKWQNKALELLLHEKGDRENANQKLQLYKERKPYRE